MARTLDHIGLDWIYPALHDPVEFARIVLVFGCAFALIAAGSVLPSFAF